jgi:hypothetical protein
LYDQDFVIVPGIIFSPKRIIDAGKVDAFVTADEIRPPADFGAECRSARNKADRASCLTTPIRGCRRKNGAGESRTGGMALWSLIQCAIHRVVKSGSQT